MEWRRFGDVDSTAIKGKNCAVFRIQRKKFTIGRLEWHEVTDDLKEAGIEDHWHWVTDYGSCHRIDVDDKFIVLPILQVTIEKKY